MTSEMMWDVHKMDNVYSIEGDSTFDIRGDNEVSELRIDGSARAAIWRTSPGTTVENLIQIQHPKGDKQLESFRGTTLGRFDEDILVESVGPFLASGDYRIVTTDYYDLDAYLSEASYEITAPTSYYGGNYSMVATQPRECLKKSTVDWFRKRIRSGDRPLVLGLCVNVVWEDDEEADVGTAFILDGHHRLEAYRLEGKRAPVCTFARIDPPPASCFVLGESIE